MNKKEQEMRQQAREAIIQALKNGYNGYYCDLHDHVFNTDFYIVGVYEAKKFLEEYGVFEAIGRVQKYEKNNFRETYTDLSEPENIVNMLWYIIGEETLYEMMNGIKAWEDNWNNQATEEINSEILKAIAKKEILQKKVKELLKLGMDILMQHMDDQLRERVHMELAPCTDEEFLVRYMELHREKFDEEFDIN